jgi:hypothetical protein
MPTLSTTTLERVERLTHLDLRPLTDLPRASRVVLAGIVSIVGSLVVDAVLVAIGKALFSPGDFGPFHFGSYAPLTVLGIVAAVVGWANLVRMCSEPRWVVTRAAILVTVVLLIPDFAILPNNPAGAVATLMVMHIAIAVITYASLLLVAPATGQARSRTALRDLVRV